MELTQEQQVLQQVVQEAWENADFKRNLVANPVATIEKFIGKGLNIPEGKTLIVRDQTDENTVYINIPANQLEDVELDEKQLEAVSGGIHGVYMGVNPFEEILKPNPTFPNIPRILK